MLKNFVIATKNLIITVVFLYIFFKQIVTFRRYIYQSISIPNLTSCPIVKTEYEVEIKFFRYRRIYFFNIHCSSVVFVEELFHDYTNITL